MNWTVFIVKNSTGTTLPVNLCKMKEKLYHCTTVFYIKYKKCLGYIKSECYTLMNGFDGA